MSLQLRSPAFEHQGAIPNQYTCEGNDIAPPLQWQGIPAGTQSLALIVDDPDAPDPKAPKMTFVHWVLYNLPPDSEGLQEGVTDDDLPPGAQSGVTDFRRTGYGGPCPPIGVHRYFFKLYALDSTLPVINKANKTKVLEAMEGHVLASAELIGTYQKAG